MLRGSLWITFGNGTTRLTKCRFQFNYGNFPLQFIFRHSFWWHDPVETRFMRGDQYTVNDLTAYILGTAQSDVARVYSRTHTGYTAIPVAWGIRVWKRHADGTEEEITSGSRVATVARDEDGSGIQSATWDCPETSLDPTDAIVVRVYQAMLGTDYLAAEFITEQLNAEQLNASTWTVYYWTAWSARYRDPYYYTTGYFRWGTSTYNSRIEGFTYTLAEVTKEWHDITTWTFNLTTRKWFNAANWNFNVSAMQWNTVSAWSFTVLTRTWHNIVTYIFNLTVMAWHNLATWTFNVITKTWNNIAQWTWNLVTLAIRTWHDIAEWSFNLVTHGWHTISYWTITFTTEIQKKFIILIGGIFTVLMTIFIVYKR